MTLQTIDVVNALIKDDIQAILEDYKSTYALTIRNPIEFLKDSLKLVESGLVVMSYSNRLINILKHIISTQSNETIDGDFASTIDHVVHVACSTGWIGHCGH
jgi:hypothetical protein